MHTTPESETSPQRVPQFTPTAKMQIKNSSPLSRIPLTDATAPKAPDVDTSVPNIIVFGETGVGKSSIINMLHGEEAAATSNSAYGCTPESSYHEVILANPTGKKRYRLWDTSGLNEGDKGTVPAQQAMTNLVSLVRKLGANENSAGGVSLLVYCIRGSRLREIIRVNYDLFWGIICDGQVPIVLVITGLENEDDMDSWWWDNRVELEEVMGMKFDGHACVTSTKGKRNKSGGYMFEEEYQESVGKVRDLLEGTCASHPEALRIEGERWIADIQRRLERYMLEYNQRTGRERLAVDGRRNSQSQDPRHHPSDYHQRTGLDGRTIPHTGQQNPSSWLQIFLDLLGLRTPRSQGRVSHLPTANQPEVEIHRQDMQSPSYPRNHTDTSYGSRDAGQSVPTASSWHASNRTQHVPSHFTSATPAYQQVQGYTPAFVLNSHVAPGSYVSTNTPSTRKSSRIGQQMKDPAASVQPKVQDPRAYSKRPSY